MLLSLSALSAGPAEVYDAHCYSWTVINSIRTANCSTCNQRTHHSFNLLGKRTSVLVACDIPQWNRLMQSLWWFFGEWFLDSREINDRTFSSLVRDSCISLLCKSERHSQNAPSMNEFGITLSGKTSFTEKSWQTYWKYKIFRFFEWSGLKIVLLI